MGSESGSSAESLCASCRKDPTIAEYFL
jgi:hypothetical protein